MKFIPYTPETLTTYAYPEELTTIELCDLFISKCEKRAADYAKLQGAPRKRAVAAAWIAKIAGARRQRTRLEAQS